MVDSLLQKAAKVDSAGDQEKTPLMLALELEDSAEKTKIVQKLMAKKASISAESFSGEMVAAEWTQRNCTDACL